MGSRGKAPGRDLEATESFFSMSSQKNSILEHENQILQVSELYV